MINQAEALVAIDVNSGRSTRERNIEETALRTNLEAADEVARQLRLRDLAGLIVIDFIDMESKRHNAMVERRIKEALKNDRARIQVGHISHFGLLEMSRQRLRPSLAETSFIPCPHCGGTGHVRSTENAAIHVLRGIEDEGSKRRAAEIVVYVSTPVALYLLNHKRERLREIEIRYTMRVVIAADDAQIAPQFRIEKVRTRSPDEIPAVVAVERSLPPPSMDVGRRRGRGSRGGWRGRGRRGERRRYPRTARGRCRQPGRRRGGGTSAQEAAAAAAWHQRDEPQAGAASDVAAEPVAEPEPVAAGGETVARPVEPVAAVGGKEPKPPLRAAPTMRPRALNPRRRARTTRAIGGVDGAAAGDGGATATADLSPFAVPGADQPDLQPVYAGPTPADPFGGRAFDIFDVMDQVERAAEAQPAPRHSRRPRSSTAPCRNRGDDRGGGTARRWRSTHRW